MKKLNNILKLSAFLFLLAVTVSCIKDEDPYAAYTPERETKLITEWLEAMTTKKNDIDTTSTGLFYIEDATKVGAGPTVKSGDKVTVKYTGFFLTGQIFDDSSYHGDGTMTYVHKTDPLIKGWEEGIEVLSKGAKATFLIPSAKGYGTFGSGSIPPNTPLLFAIEVIDIK